MPRYTGVPVTDNAALRRRNSELLQRIDEAARAQGGLLWRVIRYAVADGYAVYQIVKVNKTSVRVAYCPGLEENPDEYQVDAWGRQATVPLSIAERLVHTHDALQAIFGVRSG